jgi:hypothetical protein
MKICAYTNHSLNHALNKANTFSPGLTLTPEQISTIDKRIDEFLAAEYKVRERIIQNIISSFKRALPHGDKFDDVHMRTVCAPSKTLGYTQLLYF